MFRITTFVVSLFIACVVKAQQQDTYMIYGHVADFDTHAPLYNAWVYLYDGNSVFIDSTQVNRENMNGKDGGYMFQQRFPEGNYYLKIVYPAYCSPTIPFKRRDLDPLQTIYLKKFPSTGETVEKEYAWEPTKIDILKESPAYAHDTARKEKFEYARPSDSLLTQTREEFNLDSIAGNGDDISRIKNLLYWVHNNIEHNGSHGFPEGPRTLSNIYHSSKRNNCGYNCRALAISLAEAYLAVGIPARYLTCESKEWDTDGDCHVICVAWSKSLGKWIWVDPSFASYVTDENGLLLHPGEVRFRLQHDMPLTLNEDANWNNKNKQTKEDYLETYMAKNLYILSANMLQQSEPEGSSRHRTGTYAALVPVGSNYTRAGLITTDEEWFWQAPEE